VTGIRLRATDHRNAFSHKNDLFWKKDLRRLLRQSEPQSRPGQSLVELAANKPDVLDRHPGHRVQAVAQMLGITDDAASEPPANLIGGVCLATAKWPIDPQEHGMNPS
jgi:hypothetical protein